MPRAGKNLLGCVLFLLLLFGVVGIIYLGVPQFKRDLEVSGAAVPSPTPPGLFQVRKPHDYGSERGSIEVSKDAIIGETEKEELDSELWFPILLNVFGSATITPTPISTVPKISTCFDRTGPLITISGEQSTQYHSGSQPLPENAIVDARTATWVHVDDYPVVLEGGPDICFSGGMVWGEYPYSTDWETMHDTTGFSFRTTGETTVENIRVHNYGDGISFSKGTPGYSFQVFGAHMTHIRDDCVQNDYMYSGLVEDSLFDGCYTAFSAQASSSSGDNDGSQNVWIIRDSLIRLEPMEKVYNDEGLIPGHGAFFKWNNDDDRSPRLALHNNVFRVDQPSNSESGLGLPEGKLISCSNNIVVWLGVGEYPDPLPETLNGQPCFTMTTDRTVWDIAVQNWMDSH